MTDPVPSRAAKIWRRTLTGAVLGGAVIGGLWLASRSADGLVVALVGGALSVAASWELSRMGSLRSSGLWASVVGPLLLALVTLWACVSAVALDLGFERAWTMEPSASLAAMPLWQRAVLAAGLAFVGWLLGRVTPSRVSSLPALLAVVLALWVAVPLAWLWDVWAGYGTAGLTALIVLSKVGDIAGYYGGNALGKRHPLPNLSPNKTVEGFACSALAGVVTGVVFTSTGVLAGTVVDGFLVGLSLNVAAQLGDLAESWVKRRFGVKDSGTAFGASGGVLDVVDSLLLTTPVALATWPWLLG